MGRIRFRRPPEKTFELILNLTNRHVHAQLVDRHASRIVLAAHTTEPTLREQLAGPNAPVKSYVTGSVEAARFIGDQFGQRASREGITSVYWNRPGRYHGKIKAFIDAVREHGIETKMAPPKAMPREPEVTN